ncbi:MAG TPA: HAMP domain-containing sensor histidine kinase [Solirubrobacteraceae bacterium]
MRTRLLLALVATSAVTLLAAAAALLSPLQDRLREQSRESLQTAVQSARGQLADAVRSGGARAGSRADRLANDLAARTNALYGLYELRAGQLDPAGGDDTLEAMEAFVTGRRQTTQDGAGILIAVPLGKGGGGFPRAVLTIEKHDTNLTEVVDEVQRAFITAALIGLGVALALGLVLSTTLSRRLARLRQGAQRIVREGPDAPAPHDERRDELGDLARAMAEMQQALRRQEHARRHFVATASHELRTPLTSLMGTLELLAEDLATDDIDVEDARAQVRAAQGDLERLRALAAELLDLSRLDAGIELRGEPVELGELSRAVAAEFALQAENAKQTLTVLPPPGPCWAHGDPDAVARITRILIDNALRYAPEGATITVAPSYGGEHALLSVTDDGPGVAPQDRELIFERFRRGAHASGASGFGLGLAIGRELATRLGGTLRLDAEHVPGARFVLTLAIEMPSGDHDATSEQPMRTPARTT